MSEFDWVTIFIRAGMTSFIALALFRLAENYLRTSITLGVFISYLFGVWVGVDIARNRDKRPITVQLNDKTWKIERPDEQTYIFRKEAAP